MTKEETVQYVTKTPEYTNPNILRGLLEALPTSFNLDYEILNPWVFVEPGTLIRMDLGNGEKLYRALGGTAEDLRVLCMESSYTGHYGSDNRYYIHGGTDNSQLFREISSIPFIGEGTVTMSLDGQYATADDDYDEFNDVVVSHYDFYSGDVSYKVYYSWYRGLQNPLETVWAFPINLELMVDYFHTIAADYTDHAIWQLFWNKDEPVDEDIWLLDYRVTHKPSIHFTDLSYATCIEGSTGTIVAKNAAQEQASLRYVCRVDLTKVNFTIVG